MTRIAIAAALAASLCLSFASAAERGTQEERDACTPDVYRLCNDAIPDEDRIVACLKKNRAKLSKACSKVFE